MTEISAVSHGKDAIPTWMIWFGVIVMIGAPLANVIMTLLGPNIGTVTLADGAQAETGLFKYAVRNLAAVVITAFALYKRSAAMLVLVFIMRFITEAGDLIDGLLFGQMNATGIAGYIAAMIFLAFIPYTIAIFQLWPMVRSEPMQSEPGGA